MGGQSLKQENIRVPAGHQEASQVGVIIDGAGFVPAQQ